MQVGPVPIFHCFFNFWGSQLSNEKTSPGCFGVFFGKYYPVMWGLFHEPWNKHPVFSQPVLNLWNPYPAVFFPWLNLEVGRFIHQYPIGSHGTNIVTLDDWYVYLGWMSSTCFFPTQKRGDPKKGNDLVFQTFQFQVFLLDVTFDGGYMIPIIMGCSY